MPRIGLRWMNPAPNWDRRRWEDGPTTRDEWCGRWVTKGVQRPWKTFGTLGTRVCLDLFLFLVFSSIQSFLAPHCGIGFTLGSNEFWLEMERYIELLNPCRVTEFTDFSNFGNWDGSAKNVRHQCPATNSMFGYSLVLGLIVIPNRWASWRTAYRRVSSLCHWDCITSVWHCMSASAWVILNIKSIFIFKINIVAILVNKTSKK